MEREETRPQPEKSAVESKPSKDDQELFYSWERLARLFRAMGEEAVKPDPKGMVGYHEGRAIRFAYCVLGWPSHEIASATGRSPQTLNNYIARWNLKGLRQKVDTQITTRAVKNISKDVEEVMGLSTSAIKRYLTQVVKTEVEISAKDAKLISDITANFHRILQLIKGKPTSIAKAAEMTDELAIESLASILKKARQDPMFDMQKLLNELNITPEQAAAVMDDDEGEGNLFN